MSQGCADCGVSFSEIKNNVLLQSSLTDISKWDEHIYVWILDAEREIGTYNGLKKVLDHKISNNVASTKTPLPDDFYQLESINFGHSCMYTGIGTQFPRECSCGNTSNCGCTKWHIDSCYIKTGKPIENVYISYLAVNLAEDNMPYIKQTHSQAVTAFIKLMFLQARYEDGKVPERIYERKRREWIYKKNAARALDSIPDDNEMMRLGNIWNQKLGVDYRLPASNNFRLNGVDM